ncbi:MAG TPA: hypothetical protein VKC57_01800 [Ktedonobacterales bacterium]|nr:hypothetical protein [Ktedonobacterales bacterium]
MTRIVSLEMVAAELRLAAATGTFDGTETLASQGYLNCCRGIHWGTGSVVIYTRDTGHHTSGWFKNPDYERCRHLSLSFFDPVAGTTRQPRPRDLKLSRAWLGLFFSAAEQRLLWGEPPVSRDAQWREVWHYRLFCDAQWCATKPRGEVYSPEFTERGWKSASELFATAGRIIESPLNP